MRYKYTFDEVQRNNAYEGYATLLIDHELKTITCFPVDLEGWAYFNKDRFRSKSKTGRYETDIHTCDYINDTLKENLNRRFPDYKIE